MNAVSSQFFHFINWHWYKKLATLNRVSLLLSLVPPAECWNNILENDHGYFL